VFTFGGIAIFQYTAVTTGVASNVVDLYNVATRAWTTARLSVARYSLAAASVGTIAVFAGGAASESALLLRSEFSEQGLYTFDANAVCF
jgi:hypothetical protein